MEVDPIFVLLFKGGLAGKESACKVGDLGWKDPLRRERLPTPVFWPGEFQDNTVHGVPKTQTRLSDFHFHTFSAFMVSA